MILVLGPSGVGKSTLVKVLADIQDSSKQKATNIEEFDELPSCLPTIGTNITNILLSKKKYVEVREVGGSMSPIWKSYYKDAKGIIYVIDASNAHQISSASVQLQEILCSSNTQSLPILVVLNKTDVPTKTTINEMKYLLQLSNIKKNSTQNITDIEVSCVEKDGISEIIKWLQMKK